MNQLNPHPNNLYVGLPVRQSNVVQDVHLGQAQIVSPQIHYVTVPMRFTYSTSPSASQTRPLEARFNQIQNHHIVQPQFYHQPPVSKIKRHKIFGEEQTYQEFTPRRIYVESKQYISPVLNLEIQKEEQKKEVAQEVEQQQQEKQQFVGHIQQKKLELSHQRDIFNNSEEQIKQSIAGITQKPIQMAHKKSTQSHTQPLHHLDEDLDVDQIMSVQLNSKKQFIKDVEFSPIESPPFPIPLEQPLIFQQPQGIVPLKQSQKEPIIEQQISQQKYYWHKIILVLVFSFVLFQIIK